MSDVIPKERQTAYQRWEMASFNEAPAQRQQTLSVEQIEALIASAREEARQQAREQGYAEGLEQGRRAGMEQGRAAAAQEQAQLRVLADSFGGEIARANEQIAQDVLALALDVAKAMLRSVLDVQPERVLPAITEAVHYLPSLKLPATLHLHPLDATLVRERMGEELERAGWRLVEEPQMARGGCRIETASNQIDGTAATRWHRIAAALGQESDWLA